MAGKRDRQDRIGDLIACVYDAALDAKLWKELAPRIADTFDSSSTALQIQDRGSGAIEFITLTANISRDHMRDYEAYYWQHDVWALRAAEKRLGETVTSHDLISDAEFEDTEFYQDWCQKAGQFYVLGSVFPLTPETVGVLGVHRAQHAECFGTEHKEILAKFLPHLQRALQIRRRLCEPAIEQQAALDALDRAMMATIVATRDGRILYANRHAENLLSAQDGIRGIGGRIAIANRAASERLTLLIRNAVDTAAGDEGSSGGAVAIPRIGRLPLTVLVAPFRPARDGLGSPVPAAILFLRDPEQLTAASTALQGLFGLTLSEASIASALADGKSLEDIAALHGISLNTARTHLKNILAKTGTNRQAQLASVLLRSVAVLRQR